MGRRLQRNVRHPWLRLCIGLGLLAAFFWLLSLAPGAPGLTGAVIQRNLRHDVQATALFYSDLERMPEIERRLQLKPATAAPEPAPASSTGSARP